MKHFLFLLIVTSSYCHLLKAQPNWRDTTLPFSQIKWSNYSTTYTGKENDTAPILVTARPYNGIYSFGTENDRAAMDMTFTGSAWHFSSNLSAGREPLYTFDSSDVYFLAPGIFLSNAAQFEFRVLQNDTIIIRPWSNITEFTGADFQLNEFRKRHAFLGGYRTSWNNYLVMQLRRKGQQQLLSVAVVYWQQVKPVLLSVLTMHELNERLLRLKSPFDLSFDTNELKKWKDQYSAGQLDSITGLPKRLILSPGEKDLLFFVRATIYRKQALEYRLKKNDRTLIPWKSNDVDNNFIWLRDLGPGDYLLEMRYSRQRHNVTPYFFRIEAAWFQTLLFKIIVITAALVFLGFFTLLFKLKIQRKKIVAERGRHEKLLLGLKSVYAQLNPHFIFNALSSIQGLINKNDIRGANQYLSVFGSLVRSSLANSEKQFIPLESEISTLETYLALEQLRFNFSYTIHYEDQLPVSAIEVPSLLLQPLVENAVKHGLASLHSKGNIQMQFSREGHALLAQISDNGPGFVPGTKQQGYGLKLTTDRIQILNELSPDRIIEMTITSNTADGTTIKLLFNNWLI